MLRNLLLLLLLSLPNSISCSFIATDPPEPVTFDLTKLMYVEIAEWILK